MQAEYAYFILFVLITVILLLTLVRVFRAAKGTITQLSDESRRDRLQHERIARQKYMQASALRRGTRKINGKANVGWVQNGRRARRDYHVDEAAHEVFDPVSDVRGMDLRTPWGWPGSNRHRRISSRRSSARPGIGASLSAFFRPKKLVDEQVRAQRELAIRALVEDRYGRVGRSSPSSEIEWSRPKLPPEYLKERESDQMLAYKAPQDVEDETKRIKGLRLVNGRSAGAAEPRKASGE